MTKELRREIRNMTTGQIREHIRLIGKAWHRARLADEIRCSTTYTDELQAELTALRRELKRRRF